MTKTYGATDLEFLCDAGSWRLDGHGFISIGALGDGMLYVFDTEHGGLFLWVERDYIHELHSLPPGDRLALLCGYSESSLISGPRDFLVSPVPVLPFPFTARQLWDFDQATGGTVLECFWRARDTDEWIVKQPLNVQELARALLEDEPPKVGPIDAVDHTADVDAMRFVRYLKRSALIHKLEPEWVDIEADLREASRNGLSAGRVPDQHGMWNVEFVRGWGESRGKIRARQAKASWTGPITQHRI